MTIVRTHSAVMLVSSSGHTQITFEWYLPQRSRSRKASVWSRGARWPPKSLWQPQTTSYSGNASRITWVACAISSRVAFRFEWLPFTPRSLHGTRMTQRRGATKAQRMHKACCAAPLPAMARNRGRSTLLISPDTTWVRLVHAAMPRESPFGRASISAVDLAEQVLRPRNSVGGTVRAKERRQAASWLAQQLDRRLVIPPTRRRSRTRWAGASQSKSTSGSTRSWPSSM